MFPSEMLSRRMRLVLGIAASLLLGRVASAEPQSPADPKLYVLTFENTKPVVPAGKRGVLALQIRPADGYKVNREAPLSVELESARLKFAKTRLGHKDATGASGAAGAKSASIEFKANFDADRDAGDAIVRVTASFFVCDDKICVRQEAHAETTIRVEEE
ncbi:MAG: hypothetical protein IPK13_07490 [Deltaproteobacteria bacterium]|nr:hypothetical protein [Deltaproteobacteria bacterium]